MLAAAWCWCRLELVPDAEEEPSHRVMGRRAQLWQSTAGGDVAATIGA
uniref:Uncharacterized protein n=1 Tax=Arundo donax TaxID=35708 RepID=A0A0A9BVZ2_ARUDO